MAKLPKKSSSNAATEPQTAVSVIAEADALQVTEGAASAVGVSAPTAIHTPSERSGDAVGEGRSGDADPVKPQDDANQTGAIVAEAAAGTSSSSEAEASASGINFEPSQGAAEDDGSMAGAVQALVIASGAESVEQLLHFADVGKRIVDAFAKHDLDAADWLSFIETFVPGSFEQTSLSDSKPSPAKPVGSVRVKSSRDGFRRAGIVHSRAGRTFGPGELKEKQLEALLADPSITVEYV